MAIRLNLPSKKCLVEIAKPTITSYLPLAGNVEHALIINHNRTWRQPVRCPSHSLVGPQ
jgi:hypothetical protein